MATIYLLVKGSPQAVDVQHGQFVFFLQQVKAMLGDPCEKFQYRDEEGDLIAVDSQHDFQEAIKYSLTGKSVLLEPIPEDHFLEEIPMASSVLFSEGGSIPRESPGTVLVSEVYEEPKSVSIETTPVERAEKSVAPAVVLMKEEASLASVERGEAGTNMDQKAVSCETQPLETEDRATSVPAVLTANIASGREVPKSVGSETAQIPILDALSGTDPMVHFSSVTPPIDQCETFVQCDDLPPPIAQVPALDPNVIKSLIQQEIKDLFPAKKSILRSKISANSVHQGYRCIACDITPIRGARFTCTYCRSFDLCEDCEDSNEHEHVLLKIRIPQAPPSAAIPPPFPKREEVKRPQIDVQAVLQNEQSIRFSDGPKLDAHEAYVQECLKKVMSMGFGREEAIAALAANNYNVELAINSLLGG